MHRFGKKVLVLFVTALLVIVGFSSASAASRGNRDNIVETAVAAGQFNTLVAALEATGLDAVLADDNSHFTVFAPTDDAFATLGEETINALLADPDTLASILTYHVKAGLLGSPQVQNRDFIRTVNGSLINVSEREGSLFVNDAQIVVADIKASNGVIHVIDAVMLPPGNIVEVAQGAGVFNTLVAALQVTGLDAVLADENAHYTVFAPTDDAFAALGADTVNALIADPETLSNVLLYHVRTRGFFPAERVVTKTELQMANGQNITITVGPGGVQINDANLVLTDIVASNGIIHVIDAVLIPQDDIVFTARTAGIFDTLVTALEATGLDAVLQDESAKFTVFAPTDDAFAALGEETINALLADPATLTDILLYHVLPGAVYEAEQVLNSDFIFMANDVRVKFTVDEGNVFINDAQIIVTDVEASNGIIHVIDTVLVPPGSIVEVAQAAGIFNTLVAALEATGLDAPLSDLNAQYTVFAPTDDAFALLGEETINALLADPDTLSDILLYHVTGHFRKASRLIERDGLRMLNGDRTTLMVTEDGLMINDSLVIVTDVLARNGVIHVIDAVLIPPTE